MLQEKGGSTFQQLIHYDWGHTPARRSQKFFPSQFDKASWHQPYRLSYLVRLARPKNQRRKLLLYYQAYILNSHTVYCEYLLAHQKLVARLQLLCVLPLRHKNLLRNFDFGWNHTYTNQYSDFPV